MLTTFTTLSQICPQLLGMVTGLREISCAVLAELITTRIKGIMNSTNNAKASTTLTTLSTLRHAGTGRGFAITGAVVITSPPPCAC